MAGEFQVCIAGLASYLPGTQWGNPGEVETGEVGEGTQVPEGGRPVVGDVVAGQVYGQGAQVRAGRCAFCEEPLNGFF